MAKHKFCFIGRGLLMPSIPLKLQDELGHEVVFVNVPKDDNGETNEIEDQYENMGLEIIEDPKKAEPYLNSKEWIKVAEDTLLTHVTAPLIKAGQPVLCGYPEIEKWETDRDLGMKICQKIEAFNDAHGRSSYNIRMLPQEEFTDFDAAIQFVQQYPDRWVVKEAGDCDIRALTYKGELESGMDLITRLEYLKEKGFGGEKKVRFFLQRRSKGVEIAVSGFFNGQNFLNWAETDFEHQPLLSGDRGPNCGESVNQAWGLQAKDNPLFQTVFPPLVPLLRKAGFRGFINLNGMVDEQGYHPFEWTVRMAGCPWVSQLYEMLYGHYDYGEFLADLAHGRDSHLEWAPGFTIGIRVDVPPSIFKGMSYDFLKKQLEEDKKLAPELAGLFSQNPEEAVKRLKEFDQFKEGAYEMPIIISNFHPEKARHFHWNEVKNLCTVERDGVPYGIIEPTGTTICYITETGDKPKVIDKRLDHIVESIAGLSFITRDDYDEKVEENLELLESWGYKLWPRES